MNKFILLTVAIILAGCAGAMPVKFEDMTYQKVIELQGKTKDQIFEKSKQWIASTFKSAKAVIEYENKQEGTIIGNGSMDRPISSINIQSGSLITYNMREDIKDNKVRLTFEKFTAIVPPNYNNIYSTPGGIYDIRQADLDGMRGNFDAMSENLKQYILSNNNQW